MLKIFDKIKFLFAAILAMAILYVGLTMADFKNRAQAQSKDIQPQLTNLDNEIAKLKTQNDNLQADVNNLKNNNSSPSVRTAKVVEKPVVQTQTITQTQIQEVEKKVAPQATVTIQNLGSFKVDLASDENAFTLTKKAAQQNGFAFDYTQYSFGAFITGIGSVTPTGNEYWAFYYNGAFSNVGASDQPIKKDDTVFWQLASF